MSEDMSERSERMTTVRPLGRRASMGQAPEAPWGRSPQAKMSER
jgi:hypothetical protein